MIEYIAEIGWNFLGDYALAEKMIEEAANSGATYAKFQYWNPNKLKPGSWDVDGRKEIYKKAALGINGLQNLQKLCDKYEIKFLTSVFNQEDAGIIKELGIHEIKIPSHEIVNENLHHYAAENFKRIYVSLGAGNFAEIEKAISIYNEHSSDFIGMHCVAAYPCPQEKINLNKIKKFTKICNRVGFSDHTREISTPAFAVLMGATVIEKHFTIDNNLEGRDNKNAVLPNEFKNMITLVKEAQKCLRLDYLDSIDIEQDIISNYRSRWGD